MNRYSIKDIVAILRKHGIVVTPHRYKMLEYLEDNRNTNGENGQNGEDGKDDVEEGTDWYRASRIYSSLLEEGYFISLSLIYKNLCLFRSLGLVDSDGGGF